MNRQEKLLVVCTALIVLAQLGGAWWVARAIAIYSPDDYSYSTRLEEIQSTLDRIAGSR